MTQQFKIKLDTSATLGTYLADKNGVTLYYFSNDYKGRNSCSGGCESYWPYYYAGTLTQDSIGAGLSLSDFDTIIVAGVNQTRYKGWPLYYYSPNGNGVPETAGQTGGDGSEGIWFVAKPNYSIMLANGQLVGLDGNNYTSSYTVGTGTTTYMTDARGLTLYTFSVDSFQHNKFTNSTFSNNSTWPIYDTSLIVVPSVLNKSKFSTTAVYGHTQLTYNGWPLYYFGKDMGIRGNTLGVSVGGPGKWPVSVAGITPAP
jgi:predicted lipoprotein with Yx(FWY)xxD motif